MDDEQKKLWKQLMAAWHSEHVACRRYLAGLYTERYPNDMYGWIVLGDVLGSFAQYQEARLALGTALRKADETNRESVFYHIGHLYRDKGDYRRAETWYRRAVELRATTNNLVFLGACLARQGKYSEAKQFHQQAIDLNTENPDEAYFNLGLIFRAEGNYQEALKSFERAIEHDPDYALAIEAKEDILTLLGIAE
jgi:tetratricopeptide (TPR) repeat protein